MSKLVGFDFDSAGGLVLAPIVTAMVLLVLGLAAKGCLSPIFEDTSEFEFDAGDTPPARDTGVWDSGADVPSTSDAGDSNGGAQLGACCLRQPTRDVFNICRTSFPGRCDQLGRQFRPGGRCGQDDQYPCCLADGCEYLNTANCSEKDGTLYPRHCTCSRSPCSSSD